MSMRTISAHSPVERLNLLLRAVAPDYTGSRNLDAETERLLISPAELRHHLDSRLQGHATQVRVTGSLDRRLVFVQQQGAAWVAADLSGEPHHSREWPAWTDGHVHLQTPDSWLSAMRLDEYAVHRLARPRTLLAALYHPEIFPLPRFPLAISDLARAARSTLLGEVTMADMQLGVTLPDLLRAIADDPPDILGISATFGQHDLMIKLLEAVYGLPNAPMVIAGGSLTVRNEALLLDLYPNLLIARGAGETTITDLLAHWHGDIGREQIHGIGYNGAARGTGTLAIGRRHTPKPISRAQDDIIPELDLLPATFDHHGVAQLEASRGCTNFCSFCPRGHKGQWFGAQPATLPWVLDQMGRVFDRYPGISRTIYLVDEEFIGRGPDSVTRALEMASTLHRARFRWETSCRIDQVVRLDRDRAWHEERAIMWRALVERGLRRCLFGVESGVDSVLARFNKETTGAQNALAIRTLSALGVPTRYTYITFDQLMTVDELKETYAFQGRTDLLLKPSPHLTPEEIAEGVHDPEFVARLSAGRPFYGGISYMLVSMECLIGAAYTRQAQAAGLTGDIRPSMGRQDARFADPRIGVCSEWAQLWVDRNFALDYTLKSLEKILDGIPRQAVRQARVILKDAAYSVFGRMIQAIEDTPDAEKLRVNLRYALNDHAAALTIRMGLVVEQVANVLPRDQALLLEREHTRWADIDEWRLINAADPCGT
ncbi:B12-binding domain-containing radical SAM protein [Nonomuraea sp. NPDC059007]|uniref:B12-binding domain-containing radical SAM protein n=1 Tax=Nonomuraea sp. NPDC059007 TaxID=3346692 RepID=UPI0036914E24